MSRIIENKYTITELQKTIDKRILITQEFEVSLMRVVLTDISKSLAVIADSISKKESEE